MRCCITPTAVAQYTSEQSQQLMADHGVVCSMSRSGNVWDHAAMESFFSSLKTERTARKMYRTRDDAKADVAVALNGLINFWSAVFQILVASIEIAGTSRIFTNQK
jgi:transposase InsO family protein